MTPHKVILDTDLAESLRRLPASSRREIIGIFEKLAEFPLATVEDQIRATDGRMIYRAEFKRWLRWLMGPTKTWMAVAWEPWFPLSAAPLFASRLRSPPLASSVPNDFTASSRVAS